jgi:hypothetical protein
MGIVVALAAPQKSTARKTAKHTEKALWNLVSIASLLGCRRQPPDLCCEA